MTKPTATASPNRSTDVATAAPPPALQPNPTDLGNARRLVAEHGADLRYCHESKAWLVWADGRWMRDDTNEVERRAKATVDALQVEAVTSPGTARDDLRRHARTSESRQAIKAMVELARSEPGVPVRPADLDADPWLLGCANGTLDLRTGALRPHDRGDLITKRAPVAVDPDAPCPAWAAFLDRVTDGDANLAAYLQRAVGWALTGDASDDAVFILHGRGANGKTTFLEMVRALLGDYAVQTDVRTLLPRRSDGPRDDLARLAGARFVTASEPDAGSRLADGLIKQLSGGDRIAARHLYGKYFEFDPTFKVFVATNHRPHVRGDDDAIWRRLKLVPFTTVIPEAERDPRLPERLRAELPGILAWAVRGCLAWQRDGLRTPAVVLRGTAAYRAEMDPLGRFLAECCRPSTGWTASFALYDAYLAWCHETDEAPESKKALGDRLSRDGYQNGRKKGQRVWHGLELAGERPLRLVPTPDVVQAETPGGRDAERVAG